MLINCPRSTKNTLNMSSEDESGTSSSEEEIIEFYNDGGDLSSGLDEDDEDFDVLYFKVSNFV